MAPGQRHRGRLPSLLVAAFVLLWSSVASVAATTPKADEEVIALLTDCAARLDRDRDVGYARIAQRCPELSPALTGSARSAWLPGTWQERSNELSAGGLRELARLIREESRRAVAVGGPSSEALAAVLRQVSADPEADSGWWARTLAWIRSLLSRQPAGAAEPEFSIADWLRSRGIGANIWTVLTYALFSVLIGIAIFIILTELRAAGLLQRKPRDASSDTHPPRNRAPLRLEDLAGLPLRERPALLLRLILEALTAAGRMQGHAPGYASRTRREILRDARLEQASQRDALAALAGSTEQLRYAAVPPAPPEIEASIAEGSALLRQLGAVPERAA